MSVLAVRGIDVRSAHLLVRRMSEGCPEDVRLLPGYCPVTVRFIIVRRCPDGPDMKQPSPSVLTDSAQSRGANRTGTPASLLLHSSKMSPSTKVKSNNVLGQVLFCKEKASRMFRNDAPNAKSANFLKAPPALHTRAVHAGAGNEGTFHTRAYAT